MPHKYAGDRCHAWQRTPVHAPAFLQRLDHCASSSPMSSSGEHSTSRWFGGPRAARRLDVRKLSSRQRPGSAVDKTRSGLAAGWSAASLRGGFDTPRWARERLFPTHFSLVPQRLADGLEVMVEASSKLFAPAPGFFDYWIFPHCPMPRQVAMVYRSSVESHQTPRTPR